MQRLKALLYGIAFLALPDVASAHAFGQQFTLPLPVHFYITGGVCAFIASCALLLLFSERETSAFRTLKEYKVPRAVNAVLGAIGLAGFIFAIALAFFGTQNYVTNPLPNLFWIIFLLLFTYISALIAGLWPYIDPFR